MSMLAVSSTGLTILNLNRQEDHQDIYTTTIVTGWRAKEVDSTSQVTQVLSSTAYSNLYFFAKYTNWSKTLVEPLAYSKLTDEQKAVSCTLESSYTYIVLDELEDGEYTLEAIKQSYRLYKVSQVEHKTMGTPSVRHIKVTIK